jgi:hypothetical protein
MVRLLNQGFPLRAALNIAKDQSIVGGQYIVVGDGNVDVVQSDSRTPGLLKIESKGDVYEISSKLFPTNSHGMGTMAITPFGDEKKQHLAAGEIDVRVATAEEISDVVAMENIPILFDGKLRWSQNFSIIDE